jgi:hypothetical protein
MSSGGRTGLRGHSLADDLIEERKERVLAGLEHLRARPWRRRLLGAG